MGFIDISSIYLILINVFVVLLFVFMIIAITKLYRSSAKEEELVIKNKAYERALKLLEDAQQKSLRIVQNSTARAHNMLKDARLVTDESNQYLEKEIHSLSQNQKDHFERISKSLMESYANELKAEKSAGVSAMGQVSDRFEKEVEDEINEFRKSLEKETVDTQKEVEDKINREYDAVKAKIAEYEQEKIKQIDAKIYEIIAKVSKDVMGRSIDLEGQQELVKQSLETAKKEGILS